jgi:hypothetical protein
LTNHNEAPFRQGYPMILEVNSVPEFDCRPLLD